MDMMKRNDMLEFNVEGYKLISQLCYDYPNAPHGKSYAVEVNKLINNVLWPLLLLCRRKPARNSPKWGI